MKPCEKHIIEPSDYYVYTPSITAKQIFFYPLQCGHFHYEAGYHLSREAFDSFLLMYVEEGGMTLEYTGEHRERLSGEIHAGQFLFLDCYLPHTYCCAGGCKCLWCHFDGKLARGFYTFATAHTGVVLTLPNPYPAFEKLKAVYDVFKNRSPVKEPLISKYITDLLTMFLLNPPKKEYALQQADILAETVSYISEHFADDLSVELLAARAGLSPYHFIRVFRRETGFTPHQYLMNTRIAAAKYLLKNSTLSTKSICFKTGFSCESVFCSAFKKHQGITPTAYRNS
ncbi:MAG: AraC family transcriptional regulator [Lachnospiraceae bacterium]|nr:AraC family transcriptional regulator [Lachnospiraceae bacterium]